MTFLLVGDGHSEIHEKALARGLRENGCRVEEFFWCSYFDTANPFLRFLYKLQNKFLWGWRIGEINKDLIQLSKSIKPDVLFVYRGTHIWPKTLEKIREKGVFTVSYNNDDPFSKGQSSFMWRHFIKGLRFCDLALAYRHHNISDFLKAGAIRCELFRSWFIPEQNKRVALSSKEASEWESDIVFAGHYENDGRMAVIEALAEGPWNFKLFGPEWDLPASGSQVLRTRVPIRSARGTDYNRALSGAKIAICVLSKLNCDTYTRRCFEIPAVGTMMMCEYTEDLASLFQEDKEVVFFRSIEELLEKARFYLTHEEKRKAIAEAGHRRVFKDGHDVKSRAKQLMELVSKSSYLSGKYLD